MIPAASLYPDNFDTDDNLFLVRDALRVRLLEDYTPGDTSISVEGDPRIIAKFPPTGIITLTEQISDIDERAISLYYGSHTDSTFDELEALPDFPAVSKPKRMTNVTMNVFEKHHNHIKDAVIAIQEFLGVEGTIDTKPFGTTLEGRTNFLRRLVLSPRAWFDTATRIGVAPFEVCFTDRSLRNPTEWLWNFGDGTKTSACSTISVASLISIVSLDSVISTSVSVPSGVSMAFDTDGNTICKTYYCPGKYDVTLTVSNSFGEDTITIPEYVIVRAPAPDEAQMVISPAKARADTIINLEVVDNGENSLDPIVEYTWNLGDDLAHLNSPETVASYSIGGIYDVKLRVDTDLGGYRITVVEDAINVVERTNLWLLLFDSAASNLSTTKTVSTFEFGLISETFKITTMPTTSVLRDDSFMSAYPELAYQRGIFRRNCGMAPRGTTTSGDRGKALAFWAEGSATIRFRQFEPFDEIWTTPVIMGGSSITRNWGWATLNTTSDVYFLFGNENVAPTPSAVSQARHKVSLNSLSVGTANFVLADYQNGAEELENNPDDYPATYKTATQAQRGFLARNDAGPGSFYRIKSFYVITGINNDIARTVLKVNDIPGTTKTELELTPLTNGIYVFNNSGEVAVYSPATNTWATGGPGVGAAAFRVLQDATVSGFAELSQPLRATSDGDRRAYLSYDYSQNAFVKFNEVDLTFSSLGAKPNGNEQFLMSVY